MQSNNPVFRRSEEFNQSSPYGQTSYPGYAPSPQGHGGEPGYAPPTAPPGTGRMTIDTVVQKSAMTIGLVVLMAAVTWILTPDIDSEAAIGPLSAAILIGAGGAFVLSMVISFKRAVNPGLVLAFAALEGVALGALSKLYDAMFPNGDFGGIVVQAVVGTFAAFAGTLAAYKFFEIKVGQKFRTFVIAAMFGMIALSMLEVVIHLFGGSGLGIHGFSTMGLLFAIGGLVLGVFMLILDFDFIEQGVRNGLPEKESWRAAFALTVSLVWIYTNLLRILAILQSD
jgi:uncharacterized YccA/Bax inhibitor family protein